ncbi:hypothetical protein FF38_08727 [Lucilia cuprina]|uniref:Uncharacterized protein n=1 Tax=Lucilia cuprina TaxID=7375 RepID=A0A0L0CMY9_LUCCU|nr:hypothetical protein FF38_08727 [Lucilia cuprina]
MEVTSLLLYLIIALVSVALYFIKRNLNYWKDRDIPHEEPHLIWGNLKGLRTQYHIGEIAANYYRKFKGSGPFAGLLFVQRPGVVLLDKTLIKNVLIKDFNNFTDRGMYYNENTDPLTGHLFFVDGQKWKSLRNKLSPTFTSGKMKYMYPTLLKVTDQFIHVMRETVMMDPIINIQDMLGRYTTDIISSCAFGIECNSLINPNSEFPRMGKKAMREQRHNAAIMALIENFPSLARKLGMRIFPEDVHQFFMRTVKETITYREEHKIQRNDFLNILIEMKNNENDKSGLGGLSVEEICAQVFVFFLGGFDTSSATITYALYELAQQPTLQKRLRQEINQVFENSEDNQIAYDDLKDLKYLLQVLAETLRKYPSGPLLFRKALSDYIVPGYPKYVIKKDMPILIPVLGLHNDPEFYPKPQEFDPERFAPEKAKQRDSMEYLPFGDGPRNCIGERFGQMQTRLGLAYLIRNFHFSTCPQTEIPITSDPNSFTYLPKNVVYLKVEEVILVFCLINIFIFFLYNRYTYWKRRGVLYETPVPPFGNFQGFGKTKHISDILDKLYRKFKGKAQFCGVYFLLSRSAVLLDLDLIKNILIKDFGSFHDRHAFHNVKEDPLTGHLVNLEGEEWRVMRAKLTPVFTSAKMKYMFHTVVAVGKNFSETLKAELANSPDQVLEIKDLCTRFTTDVIGSCAFGIECNSLKDPNGEFSIKGRRIFTETRHNHLVQLFMLIHPEAARQLNMKFFTDEISNFFINLVKQTVDYRLENNIKRNDFIDLLIELKSKTDNLENKAHSIDLSQGLTIEQMAAQTFVFFLADFETSSTTISFCLYELAKHIEIQEKLRQEILQTIKESNNVITYEGINSMLYLEQVISETLRLYPVLSNLVRYTNADYRVPNTDLVLEKGIGIVIPISGIHTDPEYYEDPMKFNPDRFLPEEIEKRHSAAYLPFGIGPRHCIGARFAKMQIKLGLIFTLLHYRVEFAVEKKL